ALIGRLRAGDVAIDLRDELDPSFPGARPDRPRIQVGLGAAIAVLRRGYALRGLALGLRLAAQAEVLRRPLGLRSEVQRRVLRGRDVLAERGAERVVTLAHRARRQRVERQARRVLGVMRCVAVA